MTLKNIFPLLLFMVLPYAIAIGQNQTSNSSYNISIDSALRSDFKPEGRLLIYVSNSENIEPRFSSIYNGNGFVFGKNFKNWNSDETKSVNINDEWGKTSDWDFDQIPMEDYFLQAVWVQNRDKESRNDAPGNLYSEPIRADSNDNEDIEIVLSKVIPKREVEDHELVELFSMKSEILSEWWKKPMHLKASILLPSGYFHDPDKTYPVRYNVAGYGGRYTRINKLIKNEEFMSWWTTEDAPQIITVFLDGEGPFGDSYQLDSENSGPYGEALINEFIPGIEKELRINGNPEMRFVDGCSTGGWVSLALQLFYPETFNGCWSYSPDPVSFKRMQLVNIYEDDNAFYNERNYLRPSMRNLYGEPLFSIKKEIYAENVDGYSNTYTTSGGQWGAWNALYSPKGEDGLPKPIFDPITGLIDKEVAEHWKKYDLLLHVSENWSELGPKLDGKIHVWMGDMDNFYLNNAMRDFDEFLKNTTDPKSDADIEFTPMKGHCTNYSHKRILTEIQMKLME